MNYKVATTLSTVMEAWCLVYKQYLASSLIQPNEVSIFTFPQYIGNSTAVILGQKMGKTLSTISAVLDSDRGIPLDRYFGSALNPLRRQGKKLIEIGLLADVRKEQNNYSNLVELMSAVARFGVYSNHHDYVIGVHPRRAHFFSKVFGFKPLSSTASYSTLNSAPVVLLHANGKDIETSILQTTQEIYNTKAGLDFENRYLFDSENFISALQFQESINQIIGKIGITKHLKKTHKAA